MLVLWGVEVASKIGWWDFLGLGIKGRGQWWFT